jgi:LptD protein
MLFSFTNVSHPRNIAGYEVFEGGGGGKDSTGGGGNDSTKKAFIDSLRANSDLKHPLNYASADSIVLQLDSEVLVLYNKGVLTYDKINLKADSISVNWGKSTLYADGMMDSTGHLNGLPVFKDGDQEYRAAKIAYNYKTRKGRVDAARTKQGEAVIIGTTLRKENDSTYYIKDGRFTTCDLEHPHFYIQSKKLKVIPRDKIISGPLRLVIEGVAVPLPIPFGFFPNQEGHRSGVIMPTYGESQDRGYFLRKGGYYFAISDQIDLLLRGDVFSKGGYGFEISSSYNKRYKYFGTAGFEYGYQKYGEKLDPDYKVQKNFFIRWNHDQKFSPTASLRALVNMGSSSYLQNNSYTDQDYLTNTLKSNVTFTKSFSPFNLTVNLDHTQNTSTKIVNFTLPNVAFSKSRAFPFKTRHGVSKGAFYEKIGYSYNFNFKNDITLGDSLIDDFFLHPGQPIRVFEIAEGGRDIENSVLPASEFFRMGMKHQIPITSQFTMLKYVNFTPQINFNEYWYFRTIEKVFNGEKVETRDVNGFAAARDFSFTVTANTRLYGIFDMKGKKQLKFRHTIIPSVGYNLRPDFSADMWGFYKTVQVDTTGKTQTYSRFSEGIFGGPGSGESQTINFGIGNLLEMKWIRKEKPIAGLEKKEVELDTSNVKKDPFSRINLIDNFSINSAYNIAAKGYKLAPFTFSARSAPLGNIFNVQVSTVLNPYKLDSNGRFMDTLVWKEKKIGTLTSGNLTFGSSLNSKRRADGEKPNPRVTEAEWAHLAYYRGLYVDFNIPWTLSLNYNLNYTNNGLTKNVSQTINFSGDFNMTPKWKFQATSGFDFVTKDFTYTTLALYRDLHCWEMSLRWIPFGNRQSYMFSLNVKSAALRDLKLTKRNDWQDRFSQ